MNTVAIIPARGDSKGLPRKNLAEVGGVPLVLRSVRCAQAASSVGLVVVSTDDDEIAAVASQAGATIVRRPADLARDTSSSESALLHALAEVDPAYDIVAFIQCTSPLTLPEDIDGTVAKIIQGDDSALTVAPFFHFVWTEDGQGLNHDSSQRQRRQERHGQYLETGAVYAMRRAGFETHKHRFFGRIGLHVTPGERVLEIDAPQDLIVARSLVDALQGASP